MRLARALNMHSQGGPALGVQGGWCRGRAARSGGGVPSSARPPRDAPNAPQGRAHARRWDPSGRGGEKGGRDRAWTARGCSEGTPTWGHGRVGVTASARLRPGVQLARGVFCLCEGSCCRGLGLALRDAARAIIVCALGTLRRCSSGIGRPVSHCARGPGALGGAQPWWCPPNSARPMLHADACANGCCCAACSRARGAPRKQLLSAAWRAPQLL